MLKIIDILLLLVNICYVLYEISFLPTTILSKLIELGKSRYRRRTETAKFSQLSDHLPFKLIIKPTSTKIARQSRGELIRIPAGNRA